MERPAISLLAGATLTALVSVTTAGSPPAFDPREYPLGVTAPDVSAADIERASRPPGEQLYSVYCAVCHGAEGRGDGRAAAFCAVPPADFTRAQFKVRSTPTGALPTDADLAGVIRRGAGGDGAMPGFAFLRDADLPLIIAEVKRFSPRWAHASAPALVPVPARVNGSAARGAVLYRAWGCDACHGASGRGDGRLAAEVSGYPPRETTPCRTHESILGVLDCVSRRS
jgi:mono/diheme cytochrome c family protein